MYKHKTTYQAPPTGQNDPAYKHTAKLFNFTDQKLLKNTVLCCVVRQPSTLMTQMFANQTAKGIFYTPLFQAMYQPTQIPSDLDKSYVRLCQLWNLTAK